MKHLIITLIFISLFNVAKSQVYLGQCDGGSTKCSVELREQVSAHVFKIWILYEPVLGLQDHFFALKALGHSSVTYLFKEEYLFDCENKKTFLLTEYYYYFESATNTENIQTKTLNSNWVKIASGSVIEQAANAICK